MAQKDLFKEFVKSPKENQWRTTKKVVIYTRVSSREQALHNTSLETQRIACEKYAQKHGYMIESYFGGTYESAKTDERKEFQRMLSFVKKSKGIEAILIYSYDRFSRSENASYLSEQLQELGIKVLSVIQELDVTTPEGKLQRNILYLFGNYDNELRRHKTITGMIAQLRQGYWVGACPFGYTNINRKDKANKHEYIINEDGEKMKLAYRWKADGKLNNLEIVEKLNALGCKINYKSFVRILSNPFYCGIITHSLTPGEFFEGRHKAIVSKELFLKANGKIHSSLLKGISKQFEIDELPLKTFVVDDKMKSPLTGYQQKGIYYYKARAKGSCVNISAKKLNELFLDQLRKIECNIEGKERLKEILMEKITNRLGEQIQIETNYKSQITKLENKIEALEERFICGEIERELYQKYRDKFHNEIKELSQKIEKCMITSSNLEKAVEKGMELAENISQLWVASSYRDKQRLQYLAFPEGMEYNKENNALRTSRVNTIFTLIADQTRVTMEENDNSINKNYCHSHLVDSTERISNQLKDFFWRIFPLKDSMGLGFQI
ncbi:MAG: recombinase family protein [Bacteroidetes bacterium]|nr:recombinase family protein [Bacteroidota bacterium]